MGFFSIIYVGKYCMKLQTYIGACIMSISLSTSVSAQTQADLSESLSKLDRIKQTMLAYQQSHTSDVVDTTVSIVDWVNTLCDSDGQILKKWLFYNGKLIDGEIFKYDSKGKLIEKHVYRWGKFVTKTNQ